MLKRSVEDVSGMKVVADIATPDIGILVAILCKCFSWFDCMFYYVRCACGVNLHYNLLNIWN